MSRDVDVTRLIIESDIASGNYNEAMLYDPKDDLVFIVHFKYDEDIFEEDCLFYVEHGGVTNMHILDGEFKNYLDEHGVVLVDLLKISRRD